MSVFLEYSGLWMGSGLMGSKTSMAHAKIEERRNEEVVKTPL